LFHLNRGWLGVSIRARNTAWTQLRRSAEKIVSLRNQQQGPALRELMTGQELATLQGDATSFRESLAEHQQSALRPGPGHFVLQHIPMFGEDTVGDTHDVRSYPIFR
jgi:hypothetical protein